MNDGPAGLDAAAVNAQFQQAAQGGGGGGMVGLCGMTGMAFGFHLGTRDTFAMMNLLGTMGIENLSVSLLQEVQGYGGPFMQALVDAFKINDFAQSQVNLPGSGGEVRIEAPNIPPMPTGYDPSRN